MSYAALMTDRYDEVVQFYGTDLGFSIVDQWDRPNGRGVRFELGGMRLEILDNQRERKPLALGEAADRFHVVVEVEDIEAARSSIKLDAPSPQSTSWDARLFQLRDPDGVSVTFLQWIREESETGETIQGRLATGASRGAHFTRLDWARRQFIDKLGIDPFPGTVNLIIDDPESISVWNRLKESRGVNIDNPNDGPQDCDARCFPVSIGGKVDAAIVLPDVADYATNKIEVIASVEVRNALGLTDDGALKLDIKETKKRDNPYD